MFKTTSLKLAIALALTSVAAQARNAGALVDRLVKKEVLFAQEEGGDSKDGKSVAPGIRPSYPWELTLVAGQFIFDDNLEGGGRDTTDAYLFRRQLFGSYQFENNIRLTVAPAWFACVNISVAGADNENFFSDNPFVSGSPRNPAPCDVSFKIGALKTKFAGLQFGENKGNWSALFNRRGTGIGSVDPSLSDTDFALAGLNTEGVKVDVTDFRPFVINHMNTWNPRALRPEARPPAGMPTRFVDLNVKF